MVPIAFVVERGGVFAGFHRQVMGGVLAACGTGEADLIDLQQYVWLYALLMYASVPIPDMVTVWKKVLAPLGEKTVPAQDLFLILVNISKSGTYLGTETEHKRIAGMLVDELLKAGCINSKDELVVERLETALGEEAPILVYLNNSISRSTRLGKPLILFERQVDEDLRKKSELLRRFRENYRQMRAQLPRHVSAISFQQDNNNDE